MHIYIHTYIYIYIYTHTHTHTHTTHADPDSPVPSSFDGQDRIQGWIDEDKYNERYQDDEEYAERFGESDGTEDDHLIVDEWGVRKRRHRSPGMRLCE